MKDRKRMLLKALKAAFPHNIPVIAGFTFLGIAYGVLMSTKGYGPLWSFLMSAIAFCGYFYLFYFLKEKKYQCTSIIWGRFCLMP